MLPGFRFIFVTLVLGTSVVIFGLGAAALLRATHEEFVSMPTLRTLQQQFPAALADRAIPAAPPILSVLQIEPPAKAAAAPTATNNADVANLTAQAEAQPIQGEPHTVNPVRKRSGKMTAARHRSAAHKRRISARPAAPAQFAQTPQRQELFPPLFGN